MAEKRGFRLPSVKSDALGLVLAGFCGVSLGAILCELTPAQSVAWQDPPPALYLTLTNLPARWQVEASIDLKNWFSLFLSGDIPPGRVSLQLSNTAQAQFYRVTERP